MVSMRYTSKRVRLIQCIFIMMGIIYAFLLSNLIVSAESTPGGNITDPVVRAVDVAKPAVVYIITTLTGHLTVRFSPTTHVTFPQQDHGSYSLQIAGTGAFITSQGDILTADHVINPAKDTTLDQTLYLAAAPDIAHAINQNATPQGSSQVTKDDVIQQLNNGHLSPTTSYDTPHSIVYLSTSYTGSLTAPDLKSLPDGIAWQVDQTTTESAPDQQDLAIVHVPMQDAPSVQLADPSLVHEQGKLTMIGFLDNAHPSQQPNALLTSSVNSIPLHVPKTSAISTPFISETNTFFVQGDNTLENGYNGELVLDNQGNVLGITSSKYSFSGTSDGTSFLQESTSERAFVHSPHLNTTPGQFQQLWSQAFQDYASTAPGHWQKALDHFHQLAMNYPNFIAAQPYLHYAQQQVQQALATPTSIVQPTATLPPSHHAQNTFSRAMPASFPTALALTIGVIMLLLMVVVTLLRLSIRSGKKGAPSAATEQGATSVGDSSSREGDQSRATSAAPQTQAADVLPSSLPQTASPQHTLVLKIWPCGHMNRPGASFCNICGEAAPTQLGSS